MNCKALSVVLLVCVALANAQDRNKSKYKVVCYLGSWANYRTGDGRFTIEDIDPKLCTHAIYGFAKLANNKIAVYDPWLDLKDNSGLGAFQRFSDLKKVNPQLSTLIAIGGWNEGSSKYSAMAADPAARKVFVQSVIDFCKKYDFNGLDVDWEYPANRGGSAADKKNFVSLLKELKEALQPLGLLLSAAVSAGQGTIDTAYDIPNVAKYLDFINVMAYDLHGSWEKQTGHNAPLYARPDEPQGEKSLNVDYAINYWIKNGAPRNKIILGMGLYGRSFTLASASQTELGAPAKAPGGAGPITKEPGMLGYNEICMSLKNGWKEEWIPKAEVPFAYSGDQWVGYDDKKSIGAKVDYILKNNLGGGMVWSIDTDDFRGKCGMGKYPLLSTIMEKLNGKNMKLPHDTITTAPSRPVTSRPIPGSGTSRPTPGPVTSRPTSGSGQEFTCTEEGYFRDPNQCHLFWWCVTMGQDLAKYGYRCAEESAFDEHTRTCLDRSMVPGC